MALTEALDELISDGRIDPQLAMKILGNFDQSITETLAEKVRSKMSFKGRLDTYRFCDDVWTFNLQDVLFKIDSDQVHADRIKIVACNSKKPGEV